MELSTITNQLSIIYQKDWDIDSVWWQLVEILGVVQLVVFLAELSKHSEINLLPFYGLIDGGRVLRPYKRGTSSRDHLVCTVSPTRGAALVLSLWNDGLASAVQSMPIESRIAEIE